MANWPTPMQSIGYTFGNDVFPRTPIDANPSVDPYATMFANARAGYYTNQTGVTSLALGASAGAGCADGTYPLAFSGGGGAEAAGIFTVSGGLVTRYRMTASGAGYTSAPAASLAACPRLAGAVLTLGGLSTYYALAPGVTAAQLGSVLSRAAAGQGVSESLWPTPTQALAQDATSSASTSGGGASLTWNHQVGPGANLLVVSLSMAVGTTAWPPTTRRTPP